MNEKGFVLILPLVLILLLGAPFLINSNDKNYKNNAYGTIQDSKEKANVSSVYAYVSAVELGVAKTLIEGNNFNDGLYSVSQIESLIDVTLYSKKPSSGNICIHDSMVVKGSFELNGYIISYDGKTAEVSNSKKIQDITCP